MLGVEKRIRAEYGDVEAAREEHSPQDDPGDAWHMSRIGVMLAVAALVVAGILYVAMDLKVSGAREDLEQALESVSRQNAAMIQSFDKRLTRLEAMPEKLRGLLISSDASEIALRAERLGASLVNEEQKTLAARIMDLTRELERSVQAK